jgi:hypothetical protein
MVGNLENFGKSCLGGWLKPLLHSGIKLTWIGIFLLIVANAMSWEFHQF